MKIKINSLYIAKSVRDLPFEISTMWICYIVNEKREFSYWYKHIRMSKEFTLRADSYIIKKANSKIIRRVFALISEEIKK